MDHGLIYPTSVEEHKAAPMNQRGIYFELNKGELLIWYIKLNPLQPPSKTQKGNLRKFHIGKPSK